MPCTSSCSAAVTTSSTERLWPSWITSAPLACRMRRMMLMAASWPSKSDAAVTKRILFLALYSVCREALRSVMAASTHPGPEDGRLLYVYVNVKSTRAGHSPSLFGTGRALSFHGERLGKIARLVDVVAALERGVVGEQLQRNGVQDGREKTGVVGHSDHVDALARDHARVLVGEHVQLATPGAHFLQIRFELFQQRVLGRDGDHRHVLVHQRERSVLELSRGVGLGVDVGDLLQLKRSLHRDRVVDSAPEEQGVLELGELLRPHPYLRLYVQHALQRPRQMPQRMQHFRFALGRKPAAHLGQRHGEERQGGKLGGE